MSSKSSKSPSDDEFLRVSLRHQIKEHDERCLCQECRAALFFDLLHENQALRGQIERFNTKIDKAISECSNTSQVIPAPMSKAVSEVSQESAKLIYMDLPAFQFRDSHIEAILELPAISSLVHDEPILPDEVKKEDPHPNSRFYEYHRGGYRSPISLGRGLNEILGIDQGIRQDIDIKEKSLDLLRERLRVDRPLEDGI